ncbi:DUF7331 family protein [Salinirubrum litoreum]|jgi:hypothetical protein|uniref:Uncharacterized protein n=1 Tax=Salinirubrum litoreum TaxID=1126234 RepID=A0ABD5RBY6_9EURY|nr:hypothetical protein [Salinirubrum litoreum]
MSDDADADGLERTGGEPPEPTGAETVEAYDEDDGVVFYDAENPLAWLRTTLTVRLSEQV